MAVGAAALCMFTSSDAAGQNALRAAYAFSESSGRTVADSSGNGNTGRLDASGVTLTESGHIGGGLALSGGGVVVPADQSLDLQTAMTFEAWVYPTSTPAYGKILNRFATTGTYAYAYYYIVVDGYVRLGLRTAAGETEFIDYAPLSSSRWTHIAASYDGNAVKLYQDGVLHHTYAFSGTIVPSSGDLEIGFHPGQAFTGTLDEMRIYGTALTQAEIQDDSRAAIDRNAAIEVVIFTPSSGAHGVLTTPVTATFTKPAAVATVGTSTFTLTGPGGPVAASVTYSAATSTATLTPTQSLAPLTTYTAAVVGGIGGVTDEDGGALLQTKTWTFRTAAPDSLRAAYGFDEGAGSTAIDASGNDNTGTLSWGVSWTAGAAGTGGVTFANAPVTVSGSDTLDFRTSLTFEAWVYPTATPAYGKIIDRFATPGRYAYYFIVVDGYVRLGLVTADGMTEFVDYTPLPSGQWTHIAASYDGSAVKLYRNGILDETFEFSGTIVASSGDLKIGFHPGQGFTGTLDDVRIYGAALTQEQIQADMDSPVNPQAPHGVVAHTPLSGTIGIAGTPITATFSRAIAAATLTTATFTLTGPDGSVPATVSYNANTRTATLSPSGDLRPLSDYTVMVVGGSAGVTDIAGALLPGSVVWTFRTAAATTETDGGPAIEVVSFTPNSGARRVRSTPVTATFSKPVALATLGRSTFTLTGPRGRVAARVTYSATTRTATLTPTHELAHSTTYTATVVGGPDGVTDKDGGALLHTTTWTFQTAAKKPSRAAHHSKKWSAPHRRHR